MICIAYFIGILGLRLSTYQVHTKFLAVLVCQFYDQLTTNHKLTEIYLEPLKCQTKISAEDILNFYFYLLKKIRLDFSCESFAQQRIHMKHQVLFSLKNNKKKNVYECGLLQS